MNNPNPAPISDLSPVDPRVQPESPASGAVEVRGNSHLATPGPWIIDVAGDEIHDTNGNPIATTRCHADCGLHTEAANARLIAAAPTLLEALKVAEAQLVALFTTIARSDVEAGARFAENDSAVIQARAAIAQASGER